MFSNVSIHPVVRPNLLGSYFNACNEIENHNIMHKSELFLYKYWLTQSGYFRIATTVVLGMGITDGKIPFYNVISEES